MCEKDSCCQKPDKLKGEPKECTPEQIKECHGSTDIHPCLPPKEETPEGRNDPRFNKH